MYAIARNLHEWVVRLARIKVFDTRRLPLQREIIFGPVAVIEPRPRVLGATRPQAEQIEDRPLHASRARENGGEIGIVSTGILLPPDREAYPQYAVIAFVRGIHRETVFACFAAPHCNEAPLLGSRGSRQLEPH
ncbi:hypothetical protein HDG38_005628 [Paraburkholderia sp. WSM4177]|nr:hypothetical protein [Paraburkholderia sp. WSM4177]MBB5487535.1 hypothetical protein [Paraburkholderia sp. WSM4180]